MAKLPPFPLDTFRERLAYTPETGVLTWLVVPSNNVRVGQQAGARLKIGYRKIVVNDLQFYAHHVAWYLHHGEWPSEMIDHINGDRDDNRISNLRIANQAQQNFNTKRSIKNKSGHKGIVWRDNVKRWSAYITIDKKQKFLGNHVRLDDAIRARKDAEIAICGEFSRQEAPHA